MKQIYLSTFSKDATDVIKRHAIGMELNHACISSSLDPENLDETIKTIEQDIAKAGHPPLILHAPFTELAPASIDHLAVELAFHRLEEAYGLCRHFDIKRMVVHSGYLPLIYYKSWHLEKSVPFWQKFMEDKPSDFFIAIENVFEDEPYMLSELVKGIDDTRVGICLDIGHANVVTLPEYPVEKWIEILGKNIFHFHIHNNDGKNDLHRPITDGILHKESIAVAIEQYCRANTTLTVESGDGESTVEWLQENLV